MVYYNRKKIDFFDTRIIINLLIIQHSHLPMPAKKIISFDEYDAKIDKIYDGATYKCNINIDGNNHDIKIKLANIDTPPIDVKNEKIRRLAKLSKNKAKKLLLNNNIHIKFISKDNDGYYISIVYLANGDTINDILVEENLALKCCGFDKKQNWEKVAVVC